jgi:serine/threonine protein kinase
MRLKAPPSRLRETSDGFSIDPIAMTLAAGTRLGPYEISSQIGAGGMGVVYRARDPRLGRDVAIKVLPSLVSENETRLDRFEQEARAASALNHPNVLSVFDVGTYEGAPYIVSELLEGETLASRIALGPMPVRKVVPYAIQAGKGLARSRFSTRSREESLVPSLDSRAKTHRSNGARMGDSSTCEGIPGSIRTRSACTG